LETLRSYIPCHFLSIIFQVKFQMVFLNSHNSLGWTYQTTSLMVRFHPHLETLWSYIPWHFLSIIFLVKFWMVFLTSHNSLS
jgi:hypothetical protein